MGKINFENIIKSFFLGLFIGMILQWQSRADVLLQYQVLAVLASGSVGFIVGFITEWLTSILPISMANARTYFLINNAIALIVTTLIMGFLLSIASDTMEGSGGFAPVLLIVLGMICLANLFDYMMYRRAQHKLRTYQASMESWERKGAD